MTKAPTRAATFARTKHIPRGAFRILIRGLPREVLEEAIVLKTKPQRRQGIFNALFKLECKRRFHRESK